MSRVKKGEWIKTLDGTNRVGVVRYVGCLKGYGEKRKSIWSEWEKMWDGKLSPYTFGGQLSFIDPNLVKKLSDREKPKAVRKKYQHLFKQY